MRSLACLVLSLALTTPAVAAEENTVEAMRAKCSEFKDAADTKTCEVAVAEVGKLEGKALSSEVGLFLAAIDGDNGQLVLSRKRAKHMRTWSMILSAESTNPPVEAIEAPVKQR